MSYSFQITADTKDEAVAKIAAEFEKIVASQPSHAADQRPAQDAARAFLDLLMEPDETHCIAVSMSGSLIWREANEFTGGGVNVSAHLTLKS